MMLHTPSASGLNSPVGGQDGAIPITGLGAAPKPGDAFTGAGEQAVDLRWLQARVLRSTGHGEGYEGAAKPMGAASLLPKGELQRAQIARAENEQARASGSEFVEAEEGLTNNPEGIDTLYDAAPLRGVLAMLGAWEARQPDAAR
jgi:hypothetical protein